MSTSLSPETLKKLWKSRKTMLEVLQDRKYPVEDSDFIEYKTFSENIGDDRDEFLQSMTLRYERTSEDKIIVVWPVETNLESIKDIQFTMEKSNTKRAIIVIDGNLSPKSKGFIHYLATEKIYINVYTLEEAQYNVMKHDLVPVHKVCSFAEKKGILNGYNVKEDEIPIINLADPAVRHIGAIKGQLVKIIRNSESQPGWDHVTYRIVARYPPTNKNNQLTSVPASQWLGPGGRCYNE